MFSPLPLGEEERVVWRKLANHFQPSGRAVGGRIVVTTARIIFQPHRIEQALRGKWWSIDLDSVTSLGVAAPGVGPVAVRSTLWISGDNGSDDYFVAGHAEEVAARLGGEASAPGLAPAFRQTGWTRRRPLVIAVSTVYFLFLALNRSNVIADLFVAVGALYLGIWLLQAMRRRVRR